MCLVPVNRGHLKNGLYIYMLPEMSNALHDTRAYGRVSALRSFFGSKLQLHRNYIKNILCIDISIKI